MKQRIKNKDGNSLNKVNPDDFYMESPLKFFLYSVITLRFYLFYWFAVNFYAYHKNNTFKVIIKTLFNVLFCHQLIYDIYFYRTKGDKRKALYISVIISGIYSICIILPLFLRFFHIYHNKFIDIVLYFIGIIPLTFVQANKNK
jgi:hypothetical protein